MSNDPACFQEGYGIPHLGERVLDDVANLDAERIGLDLGLLLLDLLLLDFVQIWRALLTPEPVGEALGHNLERKHSNGYCKTFILGRGLNKGYLVWQNINIETSKFGVRPKLGYLPNLNPWRRFVYLSFFCIGLQFVVVVQ